MSSIFYEHVQGEDRDNLVTEMELGCEWDELNLMLEMVQRQKEINERRAELKVLKESGSYEDYEYLLEAGEQQAQQNQKNLLQRIFEWFGKFFNNIANKFSATQNAVNQADPNAQVQIPEDYANDSELQAIGNAADQMSRIDSVKGIGKIVVAGSAIAALGGLVIYNKKKDERDNSPKKNFSLSQLSQSIPGLQTLMQKLQAAEKKLEGVFKKEPDAKVQDNTPQNTTKQPTQEEINQQNAVAQHGVAPAQNTQQQGPKVAPGQAGNAPTVDAYNVHASDDSVDLSGEYTSEAANIVDVIKDVMNDPKILLTYIQKAVTFIAEKLDWIRSAAMTVAKNTTGAVQNVANNVANRAAQARDAANVAQVGTQVAGQLVQQSAPTDPIGENEKAVYESVFGQEYIPESEEDKITKDFEVLFAGL